MSATEEKSSNKPSKSYKRGATDPLPEYFAPLERINFSDSIPLGRYASTQYLQYAIATVKDRALPRLADGQKPVQSRILYAMWEMNATAGNSRKKSARVVGDVLGKYHPHGDSSVYDALVRIAQDFTLRYPLVDGEGNFGSRDGDDAAAMRYTEARLTKFSEILLDELGEGTVDFIPNYDGSVSEPCFLPARLPILLLNGASGIAVGMATEIPSHNLKEVSAAIIALIKKPDMSMKHVLRHIKGPDFPGGAQVITSPGDIVDTYTSGRGAIRVRAQWVVEKLARGQWQLVVTELPPGVSAKKVQEEIDAITNPQPRVGKKSITTVQQRDKQAMLSVLDRMRDESDRVNPVRLVFEPKTSKILENEFVNALLARTSLETNVSMNLVNVGLDGRPTGKNLLEILSEWIAFRRQTVTKRTQFRLGKVEDRLHVLEGRLLILLNIDKVIKIIRKSDQPKHDLISAFDLSDRQADDILDMRLRQLARLEHIKIEQELKSLKKNQKSLKKILKDESHLENLIIEEIESDTKAFGDKRRTQIKASEKAILEVKASNDPITIVFSKKGWVRLRQGWEVEPSSLNFKEGDGLASLIKCRTVDPIVFLDSKGRAYSIEAEALPTGRGDGVPGASLVDIQEGAQLLHCVSGAVGASLFVATSGGYGFFAKLSDLVSNRRAGRDFMSMQANEVPIVPRFFNPQSDELVVAISEKGKLLAFPAEEMKFLSRGRGVIVMGLDDDDKLSVVSVIGKRAVKVSGRSPRAQKEDVILLSGDKFEHHYLRRARMGRVLPRKLKGPYKITDA
ncbi:MAG: DNA topoisomerase IV subunit A [Betaproteobacteria bacterium]|nr:DNA topoisomerase IV subunit A [Betaproteobacteria bacterium]